MVYQLMEVEQGPRAITRIHLKQGVRIKD